MINKEKFKFFNKITLIILGILVLLLIIRGTMASFETNGSGKARADIAFYVLDVSRQTESLKISDIKPNDSDNVYTIDVSNYLNNKITDVDMEYSLSIRTTTNIPVTYSLYLNDDTTNIMSNRTLEKDSNGTYFYKYDSISKTFSHGVSRRDSYKLVINFSSKYKNYDYQGLIDSIEISVNAKQV